MRQPWPRTREEYTYWALSLPEDPWQEWLRELWQSSSKEQYLMRLRLRRFVRRTLIKFPEYIHTEPETIFGVVCTREHEVYVLGKHVALMTAETLERLADKDAKYDAKLDL
jgi:hypothetical protein